MVSEGLIQDTHFPHRGSVEVDENMKLDWKNYIIALVITIGIFASVIFLSRTVTDQKIKVMRDAQDAIALDIASSETQFALLSELSCKNISATSLSKELVSMEERINYAETNKLTSKEELLRLKKSYFLLEIKDFLLLRKITERCGSTAVPIIYIYTTDCSECVKQGYVLTALQKKYAPIRVYSFDHSVDLSALHALLSIYNVKGDAFPIMIIAEQTYTGFKSFDEMEKNVPAIAKVVAQQKAKDAETKDARSSTTTKAR